MIRWASKKRGNRRKRIDDFASKLLFKNSAGVTNNLQGRQFLRDRFSDEVTSQAAYGILRDGFTEVEIDEALVLQILQQFTNAIADSSSTIAAGVSGSEPSSTGEIHRVDLSDASQSIPAAKQLVEGKLGQVLDARYRSGWMLNRINAWRTYHVPESDRGTNAAYSLHWHFDHHPVDQVKLFVLLSPVTLTDGPLHFLPREESRTAIVRGFRDRHVYGVDADLLDDSPGLRRLTGSPGTAVLCNTSVCLHRAGIPEPGHTRDILQLQFMARR